MRVIKNYLYNASYQLLVIFTPLITTPYVSRVLGAHASGINSYTFSWVSFFGLLGQLGILSYGNREIAYHRDSKVERSRIFLEIEALQLFALTVSLLAYLTTVFLFSSTFRNYYLLQSLWILSFGLDISWYFMGMEDFKKTVIRNTIVKLITIFLIFVVVKDKSDLWKYILLLGVAQVGGTLSLWPYLFKEIVWISPSKWHPFRHLYPSVLLFIPTVAIQIYTVVNKLMLGHMSTPNAVAQFTYADSIIRIILAIATSLGTVMLPHMASLFAKKDYEGIRNSLYSSFEFETAVSLPMAFGMMALGLKLAPWFLGNQYVPSGQVIFFEAPAIVFISWNNVIGTQYLIPVDRAKEYTISVVLGAMVNVIANAILIPKYLYIGAGVATVISEFFIIVAQLYFVRKVIKAKKLFNSLWCYLFASLVMFSVIFTVNQIVAFNAYTLILQVICGGVIYFILLIVFRAPIIRMVRELAVHNI